MPFSYYWRELTEDGLLKDPDDRSSFFPSSSELCINSWGGHPSREDAVRRFSEVKSLDHWAVPSRLILIEEFSPDLKEV